MTEREVVIAEVRAALREALAPIEAHARAIERHKVGDGIPTTCEIDDLCRILGIGKTTVYDRMKQGTFPIPEILPRLAGAPRFYGRDIEAYLRGDFAPGGAFRRPNGGGRRR